MARIVSTGNPDSRSGDILQHEPVVWWVVLGLKLAVEVEMIVVALIIGPAMAISCKG
jgi:hypothetical protein